MILVDAGPLIALLDRSDADHQRCVATLQRLAPPMVTTWPVFAEAAYMLGDRGGWQPQSRLWRLVLRNDLQLAPIEGDTLRRTCELMSKYRDQPMDLADATLVALAEAEGMTEIFTLDRDFRVYRLYGRKAFEIVP